jgi:ATP-independent RNA helicase DbpA
MDHLERQHLSLEALNTLVLDEADRMLDMGFFDDIVTVAASAPKSARPCCSRPPTPKASPS